MILIFSISLNLGKKNEKLNIERFIAKRISKAKGTKGQYSEIISKLCIIAISSSLSIIIIAICCGEGLRKNIENNFIELFSNIRIENYTNNNEISIESEPFSLEKEKIKEIEEIEEVSHIQPIFSKFSALSKDKNLTGSILIGLDSTYNWEYLKKKIIRGNTDLTWKKGEYPAIIISSNTARKLEVSLNDTILSSFSRISEKYYKKDTTAAFKHCIISGIYETEIKEYDDKFSLIDIGFLREKCKVDNETVSFYEIFLNSKSKKTIEEIKSIINNPLIKVTTINEKFPWLFQWIDMFNTNIIYIITIMTIICIINMLSFLIVLILERSKMIGILKSFGTKNKQIGKIFLYRSINITLKGILSGNIIALTLCYIQKKWKIIQLNPDSYFVNQIPIDFPWETIIQVNILSLILIQIAIIIPYYKITKFKPAKILKIK